MIFGAVVILVRAFTIWPRVMTRNTNFRHQLITEFSLPAPLSLDTTKSLIKSLDTTLHDHTKNMPPLHLRSFGQRVLATLQSTQAL